MRVTVIIATRNRLAGLTALLGDLEAQHAPGVTWDVIVVDDGSTEPVGPALDARRWAFPLCHLRTTGVGQSAARQAACDDATGDVLVFLDDDMRVGPSFLAVHLAHHAETPGAVVMGRIAPAPALARMPLFERYHARQLDRWHHAMTAGGERPRGTQLCMGNVSMRRADFEAVGGFDPALVRSEDRELGLRLQRHGCAMIYGAEAVSVHCSDHDRLDVWLRRAYLYGRFDHKIFRKHPDAADADPWRFWSLVHPLSHPVLRLVLLAPWIAPLLSRVVYGIAAAIDRAGLSRAAVTLTALVYAIQYFRGLRHEVRAQRGPGPLRRLVRAVRADHDQLRAMRAKYHGETIPASRLVADMIRRVGLQMLAWYRVMRCLDELRVPLAPMLVSRLIRHLYGADIHWKAAIAPGVSIVHGNGLVVSHAATVDRGCILFQGVTLGESVDAATGAVGAPRLGPDVHVGPGAAVLGPITVGARSKIGAGAVLMRSVAAGSLVMPPQAVVTARGARGGARAAATVE